MNKQYSPSRLVVEAFPRLKIELKMMADEAGVCACCGRDVDEGEPVQFTRFSAKFTDFNRLAAPESDYICAHCAALMKAEPMRLFKQCVICANGKAYSLTKDTHRQWFLTSPPEPPFVAIMAEKLTAIAHLIWHAPVTLDKNMLFVQRGHTTLIIDRPYLMELVDMCAEAAQIAREAGIKVTPPHPFVSLDRNLESLQHGVIRQDIAAVLETTERGRFLLAEIMNASEGELWALATLAKTNSAEPECEALDV
ncbi:MAG: hypothetical protein D6694_13925 [Gammaproteobacteria bacterium]|nr:MAG: hypothetical protein D6694_13925 [Gammaproteobacteria bacterium]